ncbi:MULTISPECIES: cupin domain-containing protein [Microbacterium]|uniref:cupin domain-containing protein n=1 Tax=Microbacterium TaxID=33882 RepID=UPI0004932AD1|nr:MULTISPECIES: cupin domain-containing protein [Microbacterium]MCV0334862.1 cupin domain-containing protein [Microbacterium sp.]MCV0373959.1 cupin domain-containing protein [Microbacterium sp.]MCV0391170.1 cupin domain-containing protein [Microbacterium sp.]MCV0418565.1 cupin domain-containing protein [Microbacterium sp.]MCV0423010.1 cupin domain-containing protein [Microbacterium sp.]
MTQRPATAERLDLAPHPEGGWFRRTWTSPLPVETPNGQRPAATCIHYLLLPSEKSEWHVVTSDELWLWHGPGRLELRLGGDGAEPGEATAIVLGPGEAAQVRVPAGVWQAARPLDADEVLVSCFVSPGFDFADWRLAASPTL